jgi:beta-galactosidase
MLSRNNLLVGCGYFWAVLLICCAPVLHVSAQNHLKASGYERFDDGWHFALGEHSGAQSFHFNDHNWRLLDLPHDWSIEGKIDRNNPSGNAGGYFPTGIGWYRKTFKVPKDWQGKQLSIYFEGVYMNSEVFINGHSLGTHPYGFTGFSYELTPYLNFGGDNLIAVRVDNASQVNCRWYSGSGIYRHVWLALEDPVHVKQWGVYVTTPKVSPEVATVQIETSVSNTDKQAHTVIVGTNIMDATNRQVATDKSQEVKLAPGKDTAIIQRVKLRHPKLWGLQSPNLYTARIKLTTNGQKAKSRNQTVEIVEKPFGIRSIQFTPNKGFELNGQVVKLNGGCVHHDNGCLGAAAYDRAEERKVELLKKAGFNAVRTAHNPPSTAFLNACDRLGLLVIDEAFDGWRTDKNKYDYALYFDKWWKKDLDAMVLRDRSHPSVIMWSIGNEIIERKEPQAVKTAKMLSDEIKRMDPTRPVTSAMTTWDKDWQIFDPLMAVHDVAGYNYQLHRAEADHERVPSRIIVQTESYPRDAYNNWKLVNSHPYIIGDFVWTALDYLGESGIGRYYYPGEPTAEHWEGILFPWHGSYCGDIDLMGNRKPISYYRSLLYSNKEQLYLAVREPSPKTGEIKLTQWAVWPTWESWTWPGFEGRNIDVEVYCNYPKVRLYLNDQLVGEKSTNDSTAFKAIFTLPYQAGVLKAVGVKNGKEFDARILRTAGKVAKIILKADRDHIAADGQDLSYVQVRLVDKNGVIQPGADNLLSFDIKGPGSIIGVDNANLQDPAPYNATSRKAWKGKALVVIKSERAAKGDIHLTVHAKGLPDAHLVISSE